MTEEVCYETKVESVLRKINPLLNKLGRKLENSAGDSADYTSEILVKVLQNLRNNESSFIVLTVDDLVNISITVARNYHVDLIRRSVRRPDTSKFSARIEEQDLSTFTALSEWGNQENNAVTKSVYSKLLLEAMKEPRIGNDLVKFIRELVNPGRHTLIFYKNWKELSSHRNPHKSRSFIPAEVVGKSLGFSPSKVSRLKERTAILLIRLGFDAYEIFPNAYEIEDDWYTSKGVHAPDRFVQQYKSGVHNPVRAGIGSMPETTHSDVRYVELTAELIAEHEDRINSMTRNGAFKPRW
jgi:hypothetical protein